MYRDPVESLEPQSSHAAALAPCSLRVGMIGIGTVGSGTFRVLARNQAEIAGRAGRGIKLVMVCARSLARAMRVVGRDAALTNDPMLVATHPDVDVVVEVAAAPAPHADGVLAAIPRVSMWSRPTRRCWPRTATKSFAAARQHGVTVAYEGAVAVSIPIIKALREGPHGQPHRVGGGHHQRQFNNFIPEQDARRRAGFCRGAAQAQGWAMPRQIRPSTSKASTRRTRSRCWQPMRLACRCVLPMRRWRASPACRAGRGLCRATGLRIKLLGVARRRKEGDADGVELRVQPALVPAHAFAGQVNGSMNAGDGEGRCCGRDDVLWRGRRVRANRIGRDCRPGGVARLQGTTPTARCRTGAFTPTR